MTHPIQFQSVCLSRPLGAEKGWYVAILHRLPLS